MITSEILGLLLNKYVIGFIVISLGVITAYFKGSSVAKRAAEEARLLAEAQLQSRLRAKEAKNAFLEKKGEQTNATINNASSIDDLLSLWDAQQPGKGKSSPSDENS